MTTKDYLQTWFALTNQPCPVDQIPGNQNEVLQALWYLMPSVKGNITAIDPDSAEYRTYAAYTKSLHRDR